MRFAIVVNVSREVALELARVLVAWFDLRGIGYMFETRSAEKLGIQQSAPIEELNRQCDAFISLGGDGTLLITSHCAMTKPVIGINVGYLGFLTEFTRDEMFPAIERVLNGTYSIHNRSQLEATIRTGNGMPPFRALNDVVIEKGAYPRIPLSLIHI